MATERCLIKCAGCGTLWKCPPTELEVTMSSEESTRDVVGHWITRADKDCPLCGGDEVDVMGCQVGPKSLVWP